MSISMVFNPPQFEDEYDGQKMRQLMDELLRLYAEFTRQFDWFLANQEKLQWIDDTGQAQDFIGLTGDSTSQTIDHIVTSLIPAVSTTSATYVDVTGASVPYASMEPNTDYAVFVRAYVGNSTSTATSGNKVRLTKADTLVAGSEHVYESPSTVIDLVGMYYYWGGIVNSGASGDLQLEQLSGNGSDTVFANNITIMMINVDDVGLDSNIFHSTDNTTQDVSDSPNWVPTGAAVTVGDGTSDWLVFGSVHVQDFSIGSSQPIVRVNDGTTQLTGSSVGRGDTTDALTMGFMQIWQGVPASTTLTVEIEGGGWAVEKTYANIMAIRLDSLVDYNKDFIATTAAFGGGSGDTDAVTLDYSAGVSADDYCFLACATGSNGNASSPHPIIRLDQNSGGDVTLAGENDQEFIANIVTGTTDYPQFLVSGDQTVVIADTLEADFNVTHGGAGGLQWTNAFILGFAWQLAGSSECFSVGNLTFPTCMLGSSHTFQSGKPLNWNDAAGVAVELEVLTTGVVGDPDIGSVVLLTGVENHDGEGDMAFLTDIGNHTLTATVASGGVAEVRGANAKFGDFSMYCKDEAGVMSARWGTTVNSTDFDFGSGDFTMECHMLFKTIQVDQIPIMSKWIWLDRSFTWNVTVNPAGEDMTFTWSRNGQSDNGSVSQSAWPVEVGGAVVDTWYHLAVCRDGNTLRLFVDGFECSKQGDTTGETFFTGDHEFELFSEDSNGAGYHETCMDNVRVTKGVARYTANFTPPTAPFPTGATEAPEFDLGDPSVVMNLDALAIRMRGTTVANYVSFDHDNTDLNIGGVNTTDINISGITSIQAGTVDVDWDDITATTYGGIIEANLLDKIAVEFITGDYTWDNSTLTIAGLTAANKVDFSHDDTDLNIVGANTTDINISGVDVEILNSGAMKFHEAGNDWVSQIAMEADGAMHFDSTSNQTSASYMFSRQTVDLFSMSTAEGLAGEGHVSAPRMSMNAGSSSSVAFAPNKGDPNTGLNGGADGVQLYAGGRIAFWGKEASNEITTIWDTQVNITASVTQTQGQMQIASSYVHVLNVANPDDVITLYPANTGAGENVFIMNRGANRLQVFPNGADEIDDLGNGVSVTVEPGHVLYLFMYQNAQWLRVTYDQTLAGLDDMDLTGAADNDLLFRSGGEWIDTGALLTWNGTDELQIDTDGTADTPAFWFRNKQGAVDEKNWRFVLDDAGATFRLEIANDARDTFMTLLNLNRNAMLGFPVCQIQNAIMEFTAGCKQPDNANFTFGTGSDVIMEWNTSRTPDQFVVDPLDFDQIFAFMQRQDVRIEGNLNTRYLSLQHDDTDFNFTFVDTTAVNVIGGDPWFFNNTIYLSEFSSASAVAGFSALHADTFGNSSALRLTTDDGFEQSLSSPHEVIYQFKTATAQQNPGVAGIRYSNADPTLVNNLYINDTTATSEDGSFWLSSLDQGDMIEIVGETNPDLKILFYVDDLTVDNTGWWKIGVLHAWGTTLPTGNDILKLRSYPLSHVPVLRLPDLSSPGTDTVGFGQFWSESEQSSGNTPTFSTGSGTDINLSTIHEASYLFDDSIIEADPNARWMRFDSATPASVTNLYFDDMTSKLKPNEFMLQNLATGDIITIISEEDEDDYLVASVSATPTDNTGWWKVPVTVIHSGLLPTDNDVLKITVQWMSQAGAVTALGSLSDVDLTGAADNDLLYRAGGEWVDTAGLLTYDAATERLELSGVTGPQFSVVDTNAAADEGTWRYRTASGVLEWQTRSDDDLTSEVAISMSRVGIDPAKILLNTGSVGVSMVDASLVNAVDFHHDGTDFTIAKAAGNTADIIVSSMSGNFWVKGGTGLKVSNAGGTDHLIMSHDGSDFNFDFTLTTEVNVTGAGGGWNFSGPVYVPVSGGINPKANFGGLFAEGGSADAGCRYMSEGGNELALSNIHELVYRFDTTITAADPGNGDIRFNSATPASVTNLYIDDLQMTGADAHWWLSNLSDGDILTITGEVDQGDFLICSINGAPTDNTGWWTVPVTIIDSGTLPASNDSTKMTVQYLSKAGAATAFSSLSDVDLTGQADNDMLHRVGGEWVDTAGRLTWDGATMAIKDSGLTNAFTMNHTGSALFVELDAVGGIQYEDGQGNHRITLRTDVVGPGISLFGEADYKAYGTGNVNYAQLDVVSNVAALNTVNVSVNIDSFKIQNEGNDKLIVDFANSQVNFTGLDIDDVDSIFSINQTAAKADVTGYGQWWAADLSQTSNSPMFTTDGGFDINLSSLHEDPYRYDNTVSIAPPGAGNVRFNSLTPASIVTMAIDDATITGTDNAWTIDNLAIGDQIIIASETDAADYLVLVVDAAPTDNTSWWTVPVAVLHSGTIFTNTDVVKVSIRKHTQLDTLSLAVFDSTGADSGTFTHDGANFNTVFATTTDWVLSGLTQFNLGGADIDDVDSIFSIEQTAAKADVTGYGQWWAGIINFQFSNSPIFTTDSGADLDLSSMQEVPYRYQVSVSAADPGAGDLRFNSTTPASITAIYIDDVAHTGQDNGWMFSNLAIGDILTFNSEVDPADYLVLTVSGATTDNVGWWTIPVTVLHAGTIFTAAEVLKLTVQWMGQVDTLSLAVFDSTGADSGTLTHDGTDLNLAGVNSALFNITGFGGVLIDGYLQHKTATDTELNAVANAINTAAGKVQGAEVYNSTQDVPVYAVGNADASVWVDGAGTTVNTPVA